LAYRFIKFRSGVGLSSLATGVERAALARRGYLPLRLTLLDMIWWSIVNLVAKQQERITAVFFALADPTRRRILERLSKHGKTRVTALASPFRMSLPSVSKHLRVLERAHLISRERYGRLHIIQANAKGMQEAQTWMEQCGAGWAFSLNKLDELLQSEQSVKN
jgi:DNA-binding transcriptional ArsR family regulator